MSHQEVDDQARHREFILEAIRLAEENVRSGKGGPFGCIIVLDGRVIARATNLVTMSNDPTAHAEIVAIRKACAGLHSFQLTGCDVYASCEPCPMCLGALYWARPSRVFFAASHREASEAGFDDSRIAEDLNLPFSRRRLRMKQVEKEAGLRPFEAWANQNGKVPY